jgi:hypothetical protein
MFCKNKTEEIDWIYVAQYRDRWLALVKMHIIFLFTKGREFLEQLRNRLCPIKLIT